MHTKRALIALTTLWTLVFGSAGAAFADIPPDDCYVETCTLATVTASGGTCEACQAGPVVEGGCAEQMDKGFEKICATWGASAYTEIWCAPNSGATPPGDPYADCNGSSGSSSSSDDGCSVALTTSPSDAALLVLLAAVGALVIRNRSRWS